MAQASKRTAVQRGEKKAGIQLEIREKMEKRTSRAASPSPAAPSLSSLPTITVALCASAKKHKQSFDALREAGERHNARLRSEGQQQRPSSAGRVTRADPNAGLSVSPVRSDGARRAKSHGGSDHLTADEVDRGTPRSGGRSPRASRCSSLVNPVHHFFFRFVNLNYDTQHHCMVVCTDASVKGEQPPKLPGDEEEGTDTSTSASEAARLADDVDVVLHKVATFGSPSAIRALGRWCRQAQKQRSRRRQTPLVVVDPLEKVQLLMTRSMLYKLLDNTGADGHSAALIPRTFMWDRPGAQRLPMTSNGSDMAAGGDSGDGGTVAATPLGIHSFAVVDDDLSKDARANGTAQGRWWIAKPDEGTGPAFTHHLVMWCTRSQDVRVPAAVQATLPKESNRFILQELYVYALPVVIKVYCIAPHIYIKVNPTVKLLNHLWERTHGSTVVDVPVFMDSQDNAFFSAIASLSATTSRPTLSQTTSGADYAAAPNERSATPPAQALSRLPSRGSESPQSPVALSREVLQSAATDPLVVPWESMIAPSELWDAFLAPGTPAHIAVSRLAQEMSGFGGIGLTMYGFDIVLVPQHLAHSYQRKSSRGIGRAEGATVRYESAPTPSPAPPKTSSSSGASPANPLPFKASDMFDLATGAPTSLLLDSIPVVIDVNYFPGYKGVVEANQHMMELIAAKVAAAKGGAASAWWRDNAPGLYDKKHQCNSM